MNSLKKKYRCSACDVWFETIKEWDVHATTLLHQKKALIAGAKLNRSLLKR